MISVKSAAPSTLLGLSTLAARDEAPVHATFDKRNQMSLKSFIDGKGKHTQIELVKPDHNPLNRLRNAGFMKKGRQLQKDEVKIYLLATRKAH